VYLWTPPSSDFTSSGFSAAFFGGLVVSIVSFVLSLFIGNESKRRSKD
jgi:uncharacterized membrane protein YvlD (DUF360 family)